MASVSLFTLRTRRQEDPAGTEIVCEGGRIARTSQVGMRPGTEVEVRDLFCNAPARRRFMRSPSSELRDVSRVVSAYALAYPWIGVAYAAEERERYRFGPEIPLNERLGVLYGRDLARFLLKVEGADEGIRVFGTLVQPEQNRGNSTFGHLILNGRPIRDFGLARTLVDACQPRCPKGRYPIYVLSLDLAPDEVDVNVHPAKSEVRLRDARRVHAVVRQSIQGVLHEGARPREFPRSEGGEPSMPQGAFLPRAEAIPLFVKESSTQTFEPVQREVQPASLPPSERQGLKVKGQIARTYIVCEDEEGLTLIDQHAAHEAILYETLCHAMDHGPVPTQDLLIPQTIDIPLELGDVISEMTEEWARLGFSVEMFGPGTLLVRSVPACAGEALNPQAFSDILHAFLEGRDLPRSKRQARMVSTVACRSSVMAGEKLSMEEMENLVEDLGRITASSCPHGRPFAARFTRKDLERLFLRR